MLGESDERIIAAVANKVKSVFIAQNQRDQEVLGDGCGSYKIDRRCVLRDGIFLTFQLWCYSRTRGGKGYGWSIHLIDETAELK